MTMSSANGQIPDVAITTVNLKSTGIPDSQFVGTCKLLPSFHDTCRLAPKPAGSYPLLSNHFEYLGIATV